MFTHNRNDRNALHNDIIALTLEPSLCQLLNAAMKKSHIGCLETKLFRVVVKIGFGHFHLEKEKNTGVVISMLVLNAALH